MLTHRKHSYKICIGKFSNIERHSIFSQLKFLPAPGPGPHLLLFLPCLLLHVYVYRKGACALVPTSLKLLNSPNFIQKQANDTIDQRLPQNERLAMNKIYNYNGLKKQNIHRVVLSIYFISIVVH